MFWRKSITTIRLVITFNCLQRKVGIGCEFWPHCLLLFVAKFNKLFGFASVMLNALLALFRPTSTRQQCFRCLQTRPTLEPWPAVCWLNTKWRWNSWLAPMDAKALSRALAICYGIGWQWSESRSLRKCRFFSSNLLLFIATIAFCIQYM